MSIGDAHQTVFCASRFELGGGWSGDVVEIEMVREQWPLRHYAAPLNFRLSFADFFVVRCAITNSL